MAHGASPRSRTTQTRRPASGDGDLSFHVWVASLADEHGGVAMPQWQQHRQ